MITEDYQEQPLSAAQVQQLLQELPLPVGQGLHEMLNAALSAQAPEPFSDALGELEVYLAALEVTEVVAFEQQIQLKAYVMQGWKSWRSSFQPIAFVADGTEEFTVIRGGLTSERKATLADVHNFLDACGLQPESAEWEAALAGWPIEVDGSHIRFVRNR